jgi:hypothetical protein
MKFISTIWEMNIVHRALIGCLFQDHPEPGKCSSGRNRAEFAPIRKDSSQLPDDLMEISSSSSSMETRGRKCGTSFILIFASEHSLELSAFEDFVI